MKQVRTGSLTFAALVIILGFSAVFAKGEEAIDALRQQWADLYNQGDAAGVANLYSEDAVLYDASGNVFEGRAAIQENLQSNLDAGAGNVTIKSIDMEVLGDTAFDTGSYTFGTAEGQTAAQGNYMVILKQMNGEWRIERHISNQMMLVQDESGG